MSVETGPPEKVLWSFSIACVDIHLTAILDSEELADYARVTLQARPSKGGLRTEAISDADVYCAMPCQVQELAHDCELAVVASPREGPFAHCVHIHGTVSFQGQQLPNDCNMATTTGAAESGFRSLPVCSMNVHLSCSSQLQQGSDDLHMSISAG